MSTAGPSQTWILVGCEGCWRHLSSAVPVVESDGIIRTLHIMLSTNDSEAWRTTGLSDMNYMQSKNTKTGRCRIKYYRTGKLGSKGHDDLLHVYLSFIVFYV